MVDIINYTINATLPIIITKPACFWYKWQYTGFLCGVRDWTGGMVSKFPIIIAWVLIIIVAIWLFKLFFRR